MHFGFVNLDDPQYVFINPHVTAGLSLANFAWAWTTGLMGSWHPLVWMSFMLEVSIFGLKAGEMHAANAILRTCAASSGGCWRWFSFA